jgi:pyrroline-5-carboxylate reductase
MKLTAGECINTKQCELCANRIVKYMSNMKAKVEAAAKSTKKSEEAEKSKQKKANQYIRASSIKQPPSWYGRAINDTKHSS